MTERLTLNLRGQRFELEKSLAKSLLAPDSRLSSLNEKDEAYSRENKEYYFNRDPTMFNHILNFYVTGKSTSMSEINQPLCHR